MELAERHEGIIHLVLTDVVMPHMDGIQFSTALAEILPSVEVIFMSGYAEDEIARRGIELAGDRFLAKPFTPAELINKVRDMVRPG